MNELLLIAAISADIIFTLLLFRFWKAGLYAASLLKEKTNDVY